MDPTGSAHDRGVGLGGSVLSVQDRSVNLGEHAMGHGSLLMGTERAATCRCASRYPIRRSWPSGVHPRGNASSSQRPGSPCFAGGFWPYAGEPYEPVWLAVPVAAVLGIWALRPKLTLYEDAVYIRGQILSRVIPIKEVSAVQGGYGGLDIWWGNGRMSEASAIGEHTNIDGLPGSDGRRHTMSSLIPATRNTYLNQHGLTARPDPREEDERRRREFMQRGWVEHNPPLTRDTHDNRDRA